MGDVENGELTRNHIACRVSDGSFSSLDRTAGTILGGVIDPETPLKEAFLRQILPKDLIIISAVSGDMQSMVSRHLRQGWEELLAHFVPFPSEFRDVMRSTRSVVSGSVALWFACGGPASWFPDDCDIYTPIGEVSSLLTYLKSHAGYTVEEDRSGDTSRRFDDYGLGDATYPGNQGDVSVVASVLRLVNINTGKRVDVVESSTVSALQPIPRSWSTLQANYISADNLCVAYPFLTLNRRGCITPIWFTPDGTIPAALEKYRKRGYTVADFSFNVDDHLLSLFPGITQECESNPYCPHALRFFGDKWCLQYAFDEDNYFDDPVDEITIRWRYGGELCGICHKKTVAEIQAVADSG